MLSEEIIVVGLAVLVSLIAILVGQFAADFARRASGVVVLVAGVSIVAVTLFHLAPEAFEIGVFGVWAFVGGVIVALVLDLAGRALREGRAEPGGERVAWFALFALALHSTIDGAIYSVSFAHAHFSGLLVAVGLVLHEAPEGFIALMLAYQCRLLGMRALLVAAIASSLTTPIGWAIGAAIGDQAHEAVELLFAGSAGLLAYSGVRLVVSGLAKRGKARSEAGAASARD